MAHGHPDWGISQPRKTVYPVTDLAELAARLGSINTFDRRGDTVWMDDFEDNINKWNYSGSGTGWAVALSTDQALHGAKSAKLTTGNAVTNSTYIAKHHPLPVSSRLGLEISFTTDTSLSYIQFGLAYSTGTSYREASIRYIPGEPGSLQYKDETGIWTEFATTTLPDVQSLFHTIKIVADLSSHKYTRVLLDNTEYDLSAHAP